MSDPLQFKGFSRETIDFFSDLSRNNNKEWFDRNKKNYETFVIEPARAFVTAMGERLEAVSPHIIANPKVNRSLFRIYRDIRFSPDKSPYKTHLGIFFWEGNRPRMECSGFYFHLEPRQLILGVGIYMFPRQLLDRYRRSVVDPEYGRELLDILTKISGIKDLKLGGEHYKRIPAGYDPSHPNAKLLLYNGLYGGYETHIPEELYSRSLIDYCWDKFIPLVPLHKWLVSMVSREV